MKMSGVFRETFYFDKSGPINTDKVIELAKKTALARKIRYVVLPSGSGESALRAAKVFKGTPVKLTCVTLSREEYTPLELLEKWGTFKEIDELKDLIKKWKKTGRSEYINRIPDAEAKKLEGLGVKVVYEDSPYEKSPFNSPVNYPKLETVGQLVILSQRLVCTGMEVSVKVAMMAANAAAIPKGEEVISLGGTEKGLDTAIILRPGPSSKIFDEHEGVDVREIICKPKTSCGASGGLLERVAPE
jgi:uncharacterized protein